MIQIDQHTHGDQRHCVDVDELKVSLLQQGWFPKLVSDRGTMSISDGEVSDAVCAVQKFHGLPVNGWAGYGTARKLGILHVEDFFCGLPENITTGGVSKWPDGAVLTWAMDGTMPGIPDFKDYCERGIKLWEPCGRVLLTYNGNPRTSNLRITCENLGGPGNVLADCQVPVGNAAQLVMRVDTTERWERDIDVERVICHEVGHFYGVLHLSGQNVALMNAMYSRTIDKPQPLDAAEIDKRYPGGPVAVPAPAPTPTPQPSGSNKLKPGYYVVEKGTVLLEVRGGP